MAGGGAAKLRQMFRSKPLLGLRYRLEYTALLAVAWSVPRMPRRWILRTARVIGRAALVADRRGRKLGLENLRIAVEQGGLDLKGRRPIDVLADCYSNFARGFLDLFWFSRLSAEDMDRWVEIENESHVRTHIRDDRGAIFLTPHYGIFEWSSLIIGFRGIKLSIIAQDFKNAALTDIFRRAREHSGHRVLSRDGAMLKLLRSMNKGGSVAMLPDLTVPPQGAATAVNVFGVPVSMTAAHVELAGRCGAPMFVAVCEPLEDGRARLRVLDVITVDPGKPTAEMQRKTAQAVWDHFESAIRERPELWLWMYRHWRYRPLQAGEADHVPDRDAAEDHDAVICRYPDYAAPAAEFDTIVRRLAG